MTRQEAEAFLQQTFKLPEFYDKQWEKPLTASLRAKEFCLLKKQVLVNRFAYNCGLVNKNLVSYNYLHLYLTKSKT